ncbi:MAG: DUF5689 domain-containing protein [Rikenellaceae bacterium]
MGRGVVMRGLRSLLILVAPLFVGCYDTFDDPSAAEESLDLSSNITLEMLHEVLAADGYTDIKDDLRICGSVTAHDESGNFYKTFVIEEDGYGVEILEGLTDSYVRHQMGAEIFVSLEGLRITRSRGVMQIGVATYQGSSYDIDYLGHEYLVDQHITNSGKVSEISPRVVTLEELTGAEGADFVEKLCGSLVRIDGVVYYSDEDDDDGLWSGDRCFVDASGESDVELWCYTSSYSNFSMCEIPLCECSLVGIMQSDEVSGSSVNRPVLKMRDLNDCIY